MASAAEAKLGELFLNCQEGMIFKLTIEDLGHPPTATTQQPSASLITPSNGKDFGPWK
jgi:hypothetical protein